MTNGNKPLEEEFRSSQIYKTLTSSGLPAADKIAQGLNRAAEGIDKALNGVAPPVKKHPGGTGYYQRYTQGAQPDGQPASGTQTTRPGPSYQYSYRYDYSAGPQTSQTASQWQGGGQPRQAPRTGNGQPRAQASQRPQGVTPVPAPQMKLVRKGSPAKFYITGAAALLYALNFPLYEPAHFIIFGLVLVGAFFLSSRLFRGKKEFVPVEPEKPKAPEKKPEPEEKPSRTGNPEVDKIIDEGNGYLKKLRAANDAIPDESMSEDIDRMEKAAADIFRFIGDHPGKAPQIRKFMNYYLPTTLKLLNTYQRLASQSVKGENITSTMFNIAGMMHTVADAFEKQLDSLFTDEAMDVSADISVFETLLKQEGFVDEEKAQIKK